MTTYITHYCEQNNLYTDVLITGRPGRSKAKHFSAIFPLFL